MNQATRINVATIGVIFGIGGMSHGFFETLQGNTPTGGLLIHAISAGNSWTRWTEGGEAAFTIIPNFLVTGITAMIVGLAIIIWSIRFIHTQRGPLIFLLLFILLFFVGGGIGQVAFFVPAWLVATRIHKPLSWWQNVLPPSVHSVLAVVWPWVLAVASVLILIALIIAVFGYLPGIQDMDQVLSITLLIVGLSLACFLLAFVAGFAHDIRQRKHAV